MSDPMIHDLSPIEGFVPALTDAQAKELSYMFCRSVRWDYFPGQSYVRDALVRKQVVEQQVNGQYRLATLGLSALAAHFAIEAKKAGGSSVGLIAEGSAA